MSATAFQRARREAAAREAAAREAAAEEGNGYTVAQLKDMCDERGLEYKSKSTKKELMSLLEL